MKDLDTALDNLDRKADLLLAETDKLMKSCEGLLATCVDLKTTVERVGFELAAIALSFLLIIVISAAWAFSQ